MHISMAGYSFAVAGGLIAQVDPNPGVGVAGLLIAITGLIGGVIGGATTAFSKWAEYRLSMRRLDDQEARANRLEAELADTRRELNEARDRAHERANATNDILMDVQERVGRNTTTLKAVVPVAKELADRSGVMAAIPEPGTAPDIRTIQ